MPTAGAAVVWERQSAEVVQKWERPVQRELRAGDDLASEIERARRFVAGISQEDEEGAAAYSQETLDRAVAFLTVHSEQLKKFYLQLPVPRISPGPDGSIDLHWKRQSWELLVNIPARPDEMAVFYGDNYGAQKIRGKIDPSLFNFGLANWLIA